MKTPSVQPNLLGHTKHLAKRVVSAAILLSACNDANFDAAAPKETLPMKVTVPCQTDGTYKNETQWITVPGQRDQLRLIVDGEFCPQAPAKLTVLFLIDFSLSMYNADADPVRGNDPKTDGSCGRLQAAKAITDRILKQTKDLNADVEVGLIGFSSAMDTTTSPKPLASFSSDLNGDQFCQGKGKTNYQAAFSAAKDMLARRDGTKIAYFITDGLPSLGGNAPAGLVIEHQEAAVSAAEDLRSIEGLTLNAVYLGNTFETDTDPKDLLTQVTGDADRVKIAASADKLASSILSLESPSVTLDPSTVSARFENGIDKPIAVKVTSFQADTSRDQVWTFETAAFKPFHTDQGQPVLVLEARDTKGETYEVAFSIKAEANTE